MKYILLLLLTFNVFAFDVVRVFEKQTKTGTITTYLDVLGSNSGSIQLDADRSGTGTVYFYTSNDSTLGPKAATRYIESVSDRWSVTSTGSSSFVKTFTTLPYKQMKILFVPSATQTFSADFVRK